MHQSEALLSQDVPPSLLRHHLQLPCKTAGGRSSSGCMDACGSLLKPRQVVVMRATSFAQAPSTFAPATSYLIAASPTFLLPSFCLVSAPDVAGVAGGAVNSAAVNKAAPSAMGTGVATATSGMGAGDTIATSAAGVGWGLMARPPRPSPSTPLSPTLGSGCGHGAFFQNRHASSSRASSTGRGDGDGSYSSFSRAVSAVEKRGARGGSASARLQVRRPGCPRLKSHS